MSKWETYRLGEVLKIKNGKSRPKTKGHVPVYGGNGILDYTDQFNVQGETIIIGRVGAYCGATYFENNKLWVSDNALFAKTKENHFGPFLFYLLKNKKLNQYAGGSSHPLLTQSRLNDLEIKLPPLSEQKAIAEILSSLDDKIELNNRISKNLEDLVFAFFEKLNTGETKLKLSDLIDLNPRVSLKKGQIVKYLGMADVPESGMSVSGFINREFSSGSKFQKHNTLLARITPCLENGKTAFVNFLDDGEIAFGSTEFIVMRAKEGVSPYFVYALARNNDFRQFAIMSMTGTSGRQRVQTDRLIDYEMPKISDKEMEQFHNTVKPLFEKIEQNREESIHLTELRDLLLPKLISGELTVNQAEKMTA